MSTGRYGHPGHNSHDADAEFGRAIESFVGDERIDEALRRETIAELAGRPALNPPPQRHAAGLSQLCRRNPRWPATAAVYCPDRGSLRQRRWLLLAQSAPHGQILSRAPTTIVGGHRPPARPATDPDCAWRWREQCLLANHPAGLQMHLRVSLVHRKLLDAEPAGPQQTPSKSLADRLHHPLNPSNASAPGHETHRLHGNGSLGEPFGSKPENPSAPRDTTITKIELH